MSKDENEKEERPGAIIGISEKEEMEIMREIRHLEVDLKFSDISELDVISKILPNLSGRDKLKILHYGRVLYAWGVETGMERARRNEQ